MQAKHLILVTVNTETGERCSRHIKNLFLSDCICTLFFFFFFLLTSVTEENATQPMHTAGDGLFDSHSSNLRLI